MPVAELSPECHDTNLAELDVAPKELFQNFRNPKSWVWRCHELEALNVSDNITYVTDETFETDVLNADGPVLVDFWAEWCGPCKMIAPILEEISGEYQGKIRVAKLNIDENPNTPPRYGIRGIPTLMLYKNGNVEATKVGAVSKSQLTAFIDSNI